MRIWYTSDLHFYHTNVIRYCSRPYSSVEEMNESLVSRWNEKVLPDDVVYCLGDFALAARAVEFYTPRLNGNKILVLGNHDFPHPAHQKGRKENLRHVWTQKYLDWGWSKVHLELEHQIDSRPVRLCHLPYKGTFSEIALKEGLPKHEKYRPEDDGKILICGHVHEKWKHKFTNKGTLMVNVGVDVWGMSPVSEEELCVYIKSQLESY